MTGTGAHRLASITEFDGLLGYLRDELDWPIESDDFDDVTFDYDTSELGLDPASAAKVQGIQQLRPLVSGQPWAVFFVRLEPKQLPVQALRRILSKLVVKNRPSANTPDRAAWSTNDLLFVSNYGEGGHRQISFAHFSQDLGKRNLPTLRVLGWDELDTPLHVEHVDQLLQSRLSWPHNPSDGDAWRSRWSSAFTLRPREAITTSRMLATRLADVAKAVRSRIQTVLSIENEAGPLTMVMTAFREALVHDLTADDFSDMYAQTITYGLLSARMTDSSRSSSNDLVMHVPVTSPFLKEMMATFLDAGGQGLQPAAALDFDELGVSEVVELLDDAEIDEVLRDFGNRNPQEDPVIHFYELFLKEYDAKKRMHRGVFYTPRPVVSYIVRSVHEELRQRFGLQDGLADTATWTDVVDKWPQLVIPEGASPDSAFVQVLDPATGTGTFLVEVIEVIHETMMERWASEGRTASEAATLWDEYVPAHLLPRLHGYEVLMAPYAIAHLKIGLKLHETGYHFGADERARVYLTNALEPPHDLIGRFAFAIPALAHEATAVNEVKRNVHFTVVTGNPPYSVYSSNDIPSIKTLMDDYKRVDGVPLNEVRIAPLMDDYCKFMRFADHLIEMSSLGVIGMITNHSYLTGPVFRGMRHSLGTRYAISILDLHGNYYRGDPARGDTNVFEIRPGVCIAILSCPPTELDGSNTYADLRGSYQSKLIALSTSDASLGASISPAPPLFAWTAGVEAEEEYPTFTSVTEIFSVGTLGMMTGKDHFMIASTRGEMASRIEDLADPSVSDDELRQKYNLQDSRDWVLSEARAAGFDPARLRPVSYRPFDLRWTYYHKNCHASPQRRVNDPMLLAHNRALCVPRQLASLPFEHAFVTNHITEMSLISNRTKEANRVFPLWLAAEGDSLFPDDACPNLSPLFVERLAGPLLAGGRQSSPSADEIFDYVYAVLFSPTYRIRYAESLKSDYPRLPLTDNRELFTDLARLGSRLSELHLMQSSAKRVESIRYTGNEESLVGRAGWADEAVWLDCPPARKGEPSSAGSVGFAGISRDVWEFRVGAYRVCEKWLKDRKGRALAAEEISHYRHIVAALAETIEVMALIDDTIELHGGWPDAFLIMHGLSDK